MVSYVGERLKNCNQFYKNQKENCEYFIESRNKSFSPNDITLRPISYELQGFFTKVIPDAAIVLKKTDECDTSKNQRENIQQATLK